MTESHVYKRLHHEMLEAYQFVKSVQAQSVIEKLLSAKVRALASVFM